MTRPAVPLGALPLTAIVAASARNGIGARGTLPWRLSKDMAYFRAITRHVVEPEHDDEVMRRAGYVRQPIPLKNAVIMGRHTWDSIPPRFRPLRDRINVVVSTTMTQHDLGLAEPDDDTLIARSLEDAVTLLEERRSWRYTQRPACAGSALAHTFIIGGAALYHHALTSTSDHWYLDGLLVTRIHEPADLHEKCDVFFTEFRTPPQIEWEQRLFQGPCPTPATWTLASADTHVARFPCIAPGDVAPGLEEQGMLFQFQYWQRT